ncbi:MAG: hypothetical protein KIT83_11535 [Bryobacterales bacterium]|nr:hypothetical protein [Bryobacterales bacterium]
MSEVRAGMMGTGRTVFSGNTIEDFSVEVLGVIENASPGQSIILAKLSGGPLADSGVIQGMSGSPVYVNGRLMGAVALGFPMAKQAICGIRPIEEMLAVNPLDVPGGSVRAAATRRFPKGGATSSRVLPGDAGVDHVFSRPEPLFAGGVAMEPIRTPLQLSGFSSGTLGQFASMAERLGLTLSQGFSAAQGLSGTGAANASGGPVEPGSMISVQLMRGQMQIAADGTVTHVDGERIYAFGHRFLAIGSTELPFARSEVITVLPNLTTSFKITRTGSPLGVIRQDRSVAIAGQLGATATMAPLRVAISREDDTGRRVLERDYQMEMVRDPFLAPLLLQMAVFSAVDATERSVGAATLSVDATLRFQNGVPPLRIRNMHAGGALVGLLGALGVSIPAGYALQSGFSELTLAGAEVLLTLHEQRQELRLEQVWSSTKEASPGQEVEIHAVLLDANGAEQRRSFRYRIPRGAPTGPLYFSAADATTLNLLDFPRFSSLTPRSPEQLLALINGLRTNNRLYLRVWRQEPTYSIQGADLPAPPPSAALILDRSTDVKGGRSALQNAAMAELSAEFGDHAVSGAKTIKLEVKAN